MKDTFRCGDAGALVAYLYDECEPGERTLIAAHIDGCAACAGEIDGMGATRRTLAAWTPPDLDLGFQITRAGAAGPARVLEPTIAWWRAPMPAWAQVAAALVIFAAGLSLGLARNGSTAVASQSTEGSRAAASVSKDDLAQLEQRVLAEVAQLKPVTSVAAAPVNGAALEQQVKALVDERNRELALSILGLADTVETHGRTLASLRLQALGVQGGSSAENIGFSPRRGVNAVTVSDPGR